MSNPEDINVDAMLPSDKQGYRRYDECTSTNDLARDWINDADNPPSDYACVITDHQTAGRGRRGREWWAKQGENLLMSMIMLPDYDVSRAWELAFVAALAVSDAIEAFGLMSQLKWPNDVVIGGCKVAGTLVETVVDATKGWAAIVGVGINVNQMEFGEGYEVTPTSMQLELGRELIVTNVAGALYSGLRTWEDLHRNNGFPAIVAAWNHRMAAGFEIKRGPSRGIQMQLLDTGEIEVRLADGTLARWGTVDA